jgi:F0F1-type ATP synthase epsilon subunit
MFLEIVSPEAKLFQGEVTSVSLPGVDGSFQLLNQHAPIVSTRKNHGCPISFQQRKRRQVCQDQRAKL